MSELSQPKKRSVADPAHPGDEDTIADGHVAKSSDAASPPSSGKDSAGKGTRPRTSNRPSAPTVVSAARPVAKAPASGGAKPSSKSSSSKNAAVKPAASATSATPRAGTPDLEKTIPEQPLSNLLVEPTVDDKPLADKLADTIAEPSPAMRPAPTLDVTVDDSIVAPKPGAASEERAPISSTGNALASTLSDPAPTPQKSAGPIIVRVFGRTDVGQVREHNEDNFVVADLSKASRNLMEHDRVQTVGERGTVLGVCDGMGGAAAGEVASQLAVDIVYQRMVAGDPPTSRDELATRLVGSIEAAGMRIFSEAKADRSRRGMGTTATIAALIDDHLFFGQVGDSRAYLLRGDRLVQVTRDQSLVNQLIEAGQLTEEEAETFEHNNIILQALGTAESVQVDLTYVELRQGDTLLLCSDGLSGMVRNDEIREVLRSFEEPLDICRELTDRANLAGGHDNVTVVVARFEGEGLKPLTPESVAELKYRKYELPELSVRPGDSLPGQSIRSSMRPSRPNTLTPDIEVDYEYDQDRYGEGGDYPADPVELPREQAPSWIVTMMIVSAVTCVVVAGYYLLIRG